MDVVFRTTIGIQCIDQPQHSMKCWYASIRCGVEGQGDTFQGDTCYPLHFLFVCSTPVGVARCPRQPSRAVSVPCARRILF